MPKIYRRNCDYCRKYYEGQGKQFCSISCAKLNIPRATLGQRFWTKIMIKDFFDCWIWTACTSSKYGKIKAGERMLSAHRVAYELTYGSIPDNMFVLHSCDNPSCCNPSHLFVGTQADNIRDMIRKGRRRSGSWPGEAAGRSAKLTNEDVRKIRNLHINGISQAELGRQYGVGRSCIWSIINRKTWSHII